MELRQIEDRSGCIFLAKHFNGKNLPFATLGNVKDHLESIQTLTSRPDDVLVWSYQNSGTHWLYQIAHMLRTGTADYIHDLLYFVDFQPMERFENVEGPRIIGTHLPSEYLPQDVIVNKRKILYCYRNPKDVAVSFFHFIRSLCASLGYKGNWNDFFDLYVEDILPGGSWFEHAKDVETFKASHADYPIFTVCYEEMKKDLLGEVKRISTFLECSHDDAFLKEVVNKCEAKNMMAEMQKHVSPAVAKFSLDGVSSIAYRKGDVGDWKNVFTVAQNERFDAKYEKEAPETNLRIHFTI